MSSLNRYVSSSILKSNQMSKRKKTKINQEYLSHQIHPLYALHQASTIFSSSLQKMHCLRKSCLIPLPLEDQILKI